MKTFKEWLKEYAMTEKGRKDYKLRQVAQKREKKGQGDPNCPLCDECPCTCKTASNRIKRRQT